jgi:cytochrome c
MALATLLLFASCGSNAVEAEPSTTLEVETPEPSRKEVLIFTRTAGFKHSSIPKGVACVTKLAAELELVATETKDPADFTEENLARFSAVVFLSTTGDVLDPNTSGRGTQVSRERSS